MRRPLFILCLCLTALWALGQILVPGKGISSGGMPGETPVGPADRAQVTITGQVYRKDAQYVYLTSIILMGTADSLRQEIPMDYNFIVEGREWEPGGEPLLGSRVTLRGIYRSFTEASNPGEFDTLKYYGSLGIGGKLTDPVLLARSRNYSLLGEELYRLRNRFEERLYQIFPEREAAVMATILLGDRAGLSPEVKELYQRNGIIHILSISGLHITLIGMGIFRLLRRVGAPPWFSAVCGGVTLILYGVMVGMGISVCRAVGMYLLRMLAEVAGRTYDLLTALGLVGVIMLWGNPGYLSHSGFLLSFGSVLGIGVLAPALETAWGERERQPGYREGFKERCEERLRGWGKRVRQSLTGGLSVTLATLPLQLWFYYEVPTYALFLNLLVLPFMGILMVTGLIAMILPGFGAVGTADILILGGYEKLCEGFEGLPFHTWNPGRPSGWQMALYYGMLLAFVLGYGVNHGGPCPGGVPVPGRSGKSGRYAGKPKCRLFQNILLRRILILTGLTVVVSIFALGRGRGDQVVFLDVGQGDAVCLRTREGGVYLFDGGSSSRSRVGQYVIKPYLKYAGISHVDAVCVSHPDADHCNGILELLRNRDAWGITVDRIVLPKVDWERAAPGEDPFGELREAAAEGARPVSVFYVQAGDCFVSGDVSFACLHPGEDGGLFRPGDANEASECFYIRFESGSLLLTGDVQGEGEVRLLEELAAREIGGLTVLKVAHHGSRHSTPEGLLKLLCPKLAVISSGRDNSYGHPHEELLERLREAGAEIFGTAASGAITVRFERGRAAVFLHRDG